MSKKVGILVGSLREGSYNKVFALKLGSLLPEGYDAQFVEIGHLPFYNEDLDVEGKVPQEWTDFRSKISELDAFILATPEYNRSIAPAIKNALDIGTRPYGESKWTKKPALVLSASMSPIGGAIANHGLRQNLVFLDMPVVQQPELYIGQAQNYVNENGEITNEQTIELLQTAADAFVDLIERF